MRILTLNTHSWREENADEKLASLAEGIIERDYDVIALQEVNQLCDMPLNPHSHLRANNFMLVLIEEIKKRKGPQYKGFWQASKCLRDQYEEGECIMSKMPLVEEKCFTVSKVAEHTSPKKRNIIKVTTQYKGLDIDLFSCHMGWWHDEIEPFKPQCDRLMKEVNSERLALLMGDFNNNAHIRNEGYDYLMEKGLYDTYDMAEEKDNGSTVQGEISGWTGNEEDLRIDLIVTNRKLKVKKSQVIFNGKNKSVVSDHYGVEVEISL